MTSLRRTQRPNPCHLPFHIPRGRGNYPFPLAGVNGPSHSYSMEVVWYWGRTRDKASHDLIPIPLGYRGPNLVDRDVLRQRFLKLLIMPPCIAALPVKEEYQPLRVDFAKIGSFFKEMRIILLFRLTSVRLSYPGDTQPAAHRAFFSDPVSAHCSEKFT
ncbi:hypothetical protein TNCV_3457511 [Trichonephila clavipes]|nr:hypothetical protein TNCV_3457511 [Trichonephila clavipes]